MIVIVDVNTGNLGSIQNGIQYLGYDAVISSDKDVIRQATKLILPGIGAFDTGMRTLHHNNLIPILNKKVLEEKIPVLGLCLGMQMMCASSEESESQQKGLGWFDARVVKFNTPGLKVPYMGWNSINIKLDMPLFKSIEFYARFYFSHAYHAQVSNTEVVAATAHYGYDYPVVLIAGNIIGVQFHPEKSHDYGLTLLRNFIENY